MGRPHGRGVRGGRAVGGSEVGGWWVACVCVGQQRRGGVCRRAGGSQDSSAASRVGAPVNRVPPAGGAGVGRRARAVPPNEEWLHH